MPAARGLTAIAARNAVSAAFGRFASMVVGIVLTPFVLSRIGQDLYGVMTATGSAFDYLVMLRGGLGTAMRRHVTIRVHTDRIEEAQRHYRAGFWWGFILRVPILVIGLLLAGPLCRFVRLPAPFLGDGARGVTLLMIAAIIGDTAGVFEVPTYATGNTALLSLIRAASPVTRLILVVVGFHLLLPSLTLYGGLNIVVQLLVVAGLALLARRSGVVGSPIPRPGLGDAAIRRELFSYGGLALVGQVASLLWISSNNLLIGRIYGAAAVTYYSLGARWLPLIRGFLMTMVRSLTPLFTRLEAEADEARAQAAVLRAVAVTSSLAVPVCLVPCVIGDLFLTRWVGPEYRGASVFLILMVAPLTLDMALDPVWSVLLARGRIGWVSSGELVLAIGNLGIGLLLALPFKLGILGFALGNSIALLARNFLLRPFILRGESGVPPTGLLFLQISRALMGGAPALVLLFFARRWIGGSFVTVVVSGMAAGVLGLIGSSLAAVGPRRLRVLLRALVSGSGREAGSGEEPGASPGPPTDDGMGGPL
jgi:O-antigen/teichoic acid export membrane protein